MRRRLDKRSRAARERGVTLMIVIVAIAILTAVATEFAYNSRVDLQMATNQRDEIRAYYLARSGIGLSRLLLRFQKQLDGMQIPNLGGASGFGGGLSGLVQPPGPGGARQPPATMTLQLWR